MCQPNVVYILVKFMKVYDLVGVEFFGIVSSVSLCCSIAACWPSFRFVSFRSPFIREFMVQSVNDPNLLMQFRRWSVESFFSQSVVPRAPKVFKILANRELTLYFYFMILINMRRHFRLESRNVAQNLK